MTITLPISLGNPFPGPKDCVTPFGPIEPPVASSSKITEAKVPPKFPSRTFRKTYSTPVQKTFPGNGQTTAGQPTNNRAKTFEDLPRTTQTGVDYGFGNVPDDVRYGLAKTAQAVRQARRVIIVCGEC